MRNTPRSQILNAPFMMGNVSLHWGVSQFLSGPRLTIASWLFLAIALASRLMLDLHLHTLFTGRKDLHWARAELLISTRKMIAVSVILLAFEYLRLPLVLYSKAFITIGLYSAALLIFILPPAYVIVTRRERSLPTHSSNGLANPVGQKAPPTNPRNPS